MEPGVCSKDILGVSTLVVYLWADRSRGGRVVQTTGVPEAALNDSDYPETRFLLNAEVVSPPAGSDPTSRVAAAS